MTRRPRIAKTREQKLRDCETHLYFLWEAYQKYLKQEDRFKQISAELRVLVCEAGRNKPLLLNCMDDLGFSYAVPPPRKRPIIMVGELFRENSSIQAAVAGPIPLRDFVNKAHAVIVGDREYSYGDLTSAVSQQLGSSHEDEAVDESIFHLQNFGISGRAGHIAPIIQLAKIVNDCGARFIGFLHEKHNYEPRYFKRR